MLSDGDITKRDTILWQYTLDECKPYIKYKMRNVLLREAILAYLGVKDPNSKKKKKDMKIGEYCKGEFIDDCKKEFGKGLWLVCKNCPD